MGELMVSPCSSQRLSAAAQLLLPLLPGNSGRKNGLLMFLSSVESEPGWSGVSPPVPQRRNGLMDPPLQHDRTVKRSFQRVTQQFLSKTLALEHICFLQRAEGSGVRARVPGGDAEPPTAAALSGQMNTETVLSSGVLRPLRVPCSRPRCASK